MKMMLPGLSCGNVCAKIILVLFVWVHFKCDNHFQKIETNPCVIRSCQCIDSNCIACIYPQLSAIVYDFDLFINKSTSSCCQLHANFKIRIVQNPLSLSTIDIAVVCFPIIILFLHWMRYWGLLKIHAELNWVSSQSSSKVWKIGGLYAAFSVNL